MAENIKEIEKKKSFNYGKLALVLCLLIIGVWFFSHFRISIVAINKIDSIVNKTYYSCPGVGIQKEINNFIGCSIAYTKDIIDSEITKKGVAFWWKD